MVVEATRHSGSLITARLALEENREVMAVPGNVTSGLSEGTNGLIRSGARLVGDWEDVAEGLPAPLRDEVLARRTEEEPAPDLSEAEAAVLGAVPADAEVHVDELAERTDLSVSELSGNAPRPGARRGWIVQNPGKNFQRRM